MLGFAPPFRPSSQARDRALAAFLIACGWVGPQPPVGACHLAGGPTGSLRSSYALPVLDGIRLHGWIVAAALTVIVVAVRPAVIIGVDQLSVGVLACASAAAAVSAALSSAGRPASQRETAS